MNTSIDLAGAKLLHSFSPKLANSDPVKHEYSRRVTRSRKNRELGEEAEEVSSKSAQKIADFHRVIAKTHLGHNQDSHAFAGIKSHYYDKHIIKPENIPESYWDNQRRIARELGHGDIEITDQLRKEASEILTTDQKSSFDNWFDYLTSNDTVMYPVWAKHWAFDGMLKLGVLDKENKSFSTRTKTTTAPFVDLNREVLAYAIDFITKKASVESESHLSKSARKEKLKDLIPDLETDDQLMPLLQDGQFGPLYTHLLFKYASNETHLEVTEGKWVKYPKGSDHMPLVNSIKGMSTGWCTAGEETARSQLRGGDFYVFYSLDENNNATIPRVAIRMEDDKIAEIRGIAEDQNLDSYISEVVEDKLKEFPNAESYKKKSSDMKLLSLIEKKNKNHETLSVEELRFLYELDDEIKGFGYYKDPRVSEIRQARDHNKDFMSLTYLLHENGRRFYNTGENLQDRSLVPSMLPSGLTIIGDFIFHGNSIPEDLIVKGNLVVKDFLEVPKSVVVEGMLVNKPEHSIFREILTEDNFTHVIEGMTESPNLNAIKLLLEKSFKFKLSKRQECQIAKTLNKIKNDNELINNIELDYYERLGRNRVKPTDSERKRLLINSYFDYLEYNFSISLPPRSSASINVPEASLVVMDEWHREQEYIQRSLLKEFRNFVLDSNPLEEDALQEIERNKLFHIQQREKEDRVKQDFKEYASLPDSGENIRGVELSKKIIEDMSDDNQIRLSFNGTGGKFQLVYEPGEGLDQYLQPLDDTVSVENIFLKASKLGHLDLLKKFTTFYPLNSTFNAAMKYAKENGHTKVTTFLKEEFRSNERITRCMNELNTILSDYIELDYEDPKFDSQKFKALSNKIIEFIDTRILELNPPDGFRLGRYGEHDNHSLEISVSPDEVFLLAAELGDIDLLKKFNYVDKAVLEDAIDFAKNNNHTEIVKYLKSLAMRKLSFRSS